MECPVCKAKDLAEGTQVCPKCHSDLTSFSILNQVDRQIRKKKLFLWIMFVLILLLIVLWIFVPVNPKILRLQDENESLTLNVEELTNRTTQMQGEMDKLTAQFSECSTTLKQAEEELAAAKAGGCRIHVVQPGETLGIIAKNYYGDEKKYLQLVKANCMDNPDMIFVGQRLVIMGE